jgi:hypothetical protein
MMKTRAVAIAIATVSLAACGSDAPKPVPPPGAAQAAPATVASAPANEAAAVPMPATAHADPHASPTPAATNLPPGHPPLSQPSLPPGHPPMGDAAGGFEVAPPAKGAGTGASGLAWTEPAGWVSEKPSSAMRKAQYKVPGPGGEAECVVFYFGPGQGGDAMSNASRWASQFKAAAGQAPMKTRELTSGSTKVLMVEVVGTYVGGMGSNVPGERPGYMLLGAIAQGPDSNWFFKLTGPEKTVQAQRAAFEAMVGSLKKGA